MKICFITYTVFSHGGTQRISSTIAKELSKEHEIHLLLTSKRKEGNPYNINEEDFKIDYYELSLFRKVIRNAVTWIATKGFFTGKRADWYSKMMFLPKQNRFLKKFIQSNKFDLVVGFDVAGSLWIGSIKESVGVPMIGRIQASYDHFFGAPDRGSWKHEEVFGSTLPKLNKVVVLSKDDEREFSEKLNINTRFIYNAHNLGYKKITKLNNKKFVALGRCTHHKGFDIVVEAFNIFARDNKDWNLEIVGDGPLKPLLEQKINSYNLADRITLLPFSDQVEDRFSDADVFVFSSRFEGFGIVQVEALSCGLPIIASDIPITKELLKDRGIAEFYENENPDDLARAMHTIISQDLKEMSNRALAYSKEFTSDKVAAKYNQLFKDVAGK
ncbi:glycosyltransferase [Anditalea andensis]|uniref:Glycosyl transferase family 1 domain-containing protein n=1 Tax=Anditalea andensis TaxID=1048983 RepID=A0A074KWJ2_9BACT|nr:glycosyltransferase [Anditalea andensis]KEO72580.1 hypothetical protein EL17_17740 [Anditalea andensis]